jgi:gluconokinase
MGVSGCGKSSVAASLAKETGGEFLDGDDFHPAANKSMMASGIPLTDEERQGWLNTLNTELRQRSAASAPVFLACSALRRIHRQHLAEGFPNLRFFYLKGSMELIRTRMASRTGHFMPPSLLESQFATLEEPGEAEAERISIDRPIDEIVREILRLISR